MNPLVTLDPHLVEAARQPGEKIAVALKYDFGDGAPVVTAKGRGHVAEKILETAREFAQGAAAGRASFEQYAAVARHAHSRGLGINAGHDLDLDNLPLFATLPHLAEVSIGHALISRALFHGLHSVVREYLAVCAQPQRA